MRNVFCSLTMVLLVCWPLAGQAADTRKQLREVEATLQEKKAAAERMAQALGSSDSEVKTIQQQLQQAARDEAEQQAVLAAVTTEQEDLRIRAESARQAMVATAQRQSDALGLMLRFSQLPVAVWWLYDGVSLDQERRMVLLRGTANSLSAQAAQLRQAIMLAEDLQKRLAEKQMQLHAAKAKLQERAALLNSMIAERQKMANAHREEFSALQREMTQLASAATDLRSLLDKMSKQEDVTPNKLAIVKPVDKTIEKGGAVKDGVAGSLLPVAGLISRGYGVKDSYGITSRGLTLSAAAGARIVAPLAGKAVFVGPFKGYGTIVILQHSGGYHSLLAGFGKLDIVLGQKLLAGEPIGVAGASKPGGSEAEIYFELRRNSEPINPLAAKKS